ncbi:MAG: cobalt transporter CbiM [Planctomycetes bacterium]|nr:cobalt transporter CbiM [Planctomycetota bacterium]
MHIHEAVLSGSPAGMAVLGAGAVATVVGTAIGLRSLDDERIPRVAIVTSAFFVVSLIHVPLGVTSVHLVLNGLMGLILGWAAFPALLVALLLQALLFGHGGLLALGVNTLAMALPAVLCGGVCGRYLAPRSRQSHVGSGELPTRRATFVAGFSAGALAASLAALLMALVLWCAGEELRLLAQALFGFQMVVAVVEGLITGSVVLFLRRVRPELLAGGAMRPKAVRC